MPTVVTSTISLSGTPDYSTLASWENASPADLVAADQVWRGEIQQPNDVFTSTGTVVTIGGSTTDATRYKELTTATGASFRDHADAATNPLKYDNTKGASIESTGSATFTVAITESHSRISNLQLIHDVAGTSGPLGISGTSNVVENCIIQLGSANGEKIQIGSGARLINCLVIGGVDTHAKLVRAVTGESFYHNCTFLVPTDFVAASYVYSHELSGDTNSTNCAFFGAANVENTTIGTYTTCFTDDASSPPVGCTTVAFDTTTGSGFEGITVATLDARLKSTSSLIDAGTDDASFASTDILGTSRTLGEYDVGVYEFTGVSITSTFLPLTGVGI